MKIVLKSLFLFLLPTAIVMGRAPHVDEGSHFKSIELSRNLSSTNSDESCQNNVRLYDCVQFEAASEGALVRFSRKLSGEGELKRFEVRLRGFCTLESNQEVLVFIISELMGAKRIDLKNVVMDPFSSALVDIYYEGKSLVDQLRQQKYISEDCK